MRIIPIPPPSLCNTIPGQYPDRAHMILPASCDNLEYSLFYSGPRAPRGSYKERPELRILDNGMAEGNMVEPDKLLAMADAYHVDEVVVPDAYENYSETVSLVLKFGEVMSNHPRRYGYMGVLQGTSKSEIAALLEFYKGLPWIKTIGIPRMMVKRFGPRIRLEIATLITSKFAGRFHVHLLGVNPDYPNEVAGFHSQLAGLIRSIDTSLPYSFARYGVPLSSRFRIPRPDDWNTYEWSEQEKDLALNNINTFRGWATGSPKL